MDRSSLALGYDYLYTFSSHHFRRFLSPFWDWKVIGRINCSIIPTFPISHLKLCIMPSRIISMVHLIVRISFCPWHAISSIVSHGTSCCICATFIVRCIIITATIRWSSWPSGSPLWLSWLPIPEIVWPSRVKALPLPWDGTLSSCLTLLWRVASSWSQIVIPSLTNQGLLW